MIYVVYFLKKPDGTAFYVGKSSYQDEKKKYQRLFVHKYEAKRGNITWKCRVIRKLWRDSQEPIMDIVFETPLEEEAFEVEKLLIAITPDITNHTSGGEGQCGYKHTIEAKRKMSAVHLGHRHTEESKANISLAQRGAKGNKAKLTKLQVEEILVKRHSGDTYESIADSYGVNEQTIWNIVNGKSWVDVPRPDFSNTTIKGKWRSGTTKITNEQRPTIRLEYQTSNATMQQLADKYGVSVATISLIINFKRK